MVADDIAHVKSQVPKVRGPNIAGPHTLVFQAGAVDTAASQCDPGVHNLWMEGVQSVYFDDVIHVLNDHFIRFCSAHCIKRTVGW